MIFSILIGLLTVQGFLLLVPPVIIKVSSNNWLLKKRGATAVNNPFGVLIAKDQEHYHAVLAQEIYECETRKSLIHLIRSIVSIKEARRIEATGQTITVLMMCQLDRSLSLPDARYRRAEFIAKSYKQFDGWTPASVEHLMKNQNYIAQKWVDHYLDERGHTIL